MTDVRRFVSRAATAVRTAGGRLAGGRIRDEHFVPGTDLERNGDDLRPADEPLMCLDPIRIALPPDADPRSGVADATDAMIRS